MTTIVKKKEADKKVKNHNSDSKIKIKEMQEQKRIAYLKKVRKQLEIHCTNCGGDMN